MAAAVLVCGLQPLSPEADIAICARDVFTNFFCDLVTIAVPACRTGCASSTTKCLAGAGVCQAAEDLVRIQTIGWRSLSLAVEQFQIRQSRKCSPKDKMY